MSDALLAQGDLSTSAALHLAFVDFSALLVLLAGVPVLLAVYAGFALLSHERRVRQLEALAATLEGGSALTPTSFFADLTSCRVMGRLGSHPVTVSFVRRDSGKSSHLATVYDVEVRHPAASFEVSEADLLRRLGRWLGLLRGDALAEADLVLREGAPAAGRLLQAHDVQGALRRVLALPGVGSVSLRGTTLRVEERGAYVAVRSLRRALEALVDLARRCDRVPVSELVSVRPKAAPAPSIAGRFAWTGGGEAARCPYCRDGLDAQAPDADACERCGTVHHRDCLAEAGGCTIFGCGARPSAPAQARA